MTSTGAIVAVLVAAIAAGGAYLAAVRRMSGRIATTEAAALWQESSSIRGDYRQRAASAEARIEALETRCGMLEAGNQQLARENLTLAGKIIDCERACQDVQRRLDGSELENDELRQTIRRLEGKP